MFQEYGLILVLVALVAGVSAASPRFATPDNWWNMLLQYSTIGLMAMAGTFVMIAGGFDFSVGGTYAFSGILVASLLSNSVPVPLAILIVLFVGTAIGCLNGVVITKAHVNAFVATLGIGQAFRGAALVFTDAKPILIESQAFDVLGRGKLGPAAVGGLIAAGGFIISGLVLARSVFGRQVYAVGGNLEASRFAGIRTTRITIMTYALSGCAAALAGMIIASRLGLGQPDIGIGIEIDVIIAIVLGGTAIGGGQGAIWRTAVGVAILAVMQNGFDSLGLDPFYQIVIKGGILVAAVAWDEYARRRKVAESVVLLGPEALGPTDRIR